MLRMRTELNPVRPTVVITGRPDVADLIEEEIVLGLRYPREQLVEDDPMARFEAFHHALFALSDNAALVAAIRSHAQVIHAVRSVTVTSPEYLHRARTEHLTMIRALREQDTALLAETCRAHLLPSRDAYLRRLGS